MHWSSFFLSVLFTQSIIKFHDLTHSKHVLYLKYDNFWIQKSVFSLSLIPHKVVQCKQSDGSARWTDFPLLAESMQRFLSSPQLWLGTATYTENGAGTRAGAEAGAGTSHDCAAIKRWGMAAIEVSSSAAVAVAVDVCVAVAVAVNADAAVARWRLFMCCSSRMLCVSGGHIFCCCVCKRFAN